VLWNKFSEHVDSHIREFLMVARQYGLNLNLSKCRFAQTETVYVGHLVGGGSYRPDPVKLHAIIDLKTPKIRSNSGKSLEHLGFTDPMSVATQDSPKHSLI